MNISKNFVTQDGIVTGITVRGEPGVAAWDNFDNATDLSELGVPREISDALNKWHVAWFWSTFKPPWPDLCDEQGLALAQAIKSWAGPNVHVRYAPVVGEDIVAHEHPIFSDSQGDLNQLIFHRRRT